MQPSDTSARRFEMGGEPLTIVGVVPSGFIFTCRPMRSAAHLEAWVPGVEDTKNHRARSAFSPRSADSGWIGLGEAGALRPYPFDSRPTIQRTAGPRA
jgi:hypothetical protein